MILLDTDHTTFLKYPDSERGRRMIDRLDAASASEVMGVAIVTVEEQDARLAGRDRRESALRQIAGYRELALLFEFYQQLEIVPFDEAAARQFDDLRRQKLRIGSRDLKIAATAWSTTHFFCLPIDPTSRQCQACESRTGWTDGTSGGVRKRSAPLSVLVRKLIASLFPSAPSVLVRKLSRPCFRPW